MAWPRHRYDKTAADYLAGLHVAAIFIWSARWSGRSALGHARRLGGLVDRLFLGAQVGGTHVGALHPAEQADDLGGAS
ncbi:hypothetical protein GCM10010206_17770 [Streptomyces cinerochromogenes]|nr:hypothetical protein GCM10010206_17770 [Streptomyces cinerochromogenes]